MTAILRWLTWPWRKWCEHCEKPLYPESCTPYYGDCRDSDH